MGLFEGQVAWVTGAGRGIGRATTLALAEQGAAVALASRTPSEMEEVMAQVRARGGIAITSLLDVSNWDMVHWTAQQNEAALGPIDILINNAGVLEPLGKLWETDPEQAGRLFDINLSGAYYCLRAVLPGMVKRGRGVIVNVSSGAATRVAPGWSVYAASKVDWISSHATSRSISRDCPFVSIRFIQAWWKRECWRHCERPRPISCRPIGGSISLIKWKQARCCRPRFRHAR